jgi:hypothetical protein
VRCRASFDVAPRGSHHQGLRASHEQATASRLAFVHDRA